MRHKSLGLVFLFVVCCLFTATVKANDFAIGTVLEDFKLKNLEGVEQSFNSLRGEKGTIIVFLSAQCPVVKQYNERINQLAADYKAKGINFVGIQPNTLSESLEWMKSESKDAGYEFPVLVDNDFWLSDKLGATVTPEMYLFDADNKLVYHGAIDNDRSGRNISENFLRVALDEKLSGKEIARNRTKAFGCTIKRKDQVK
jgi:peroxiredoxin